MNVIREAVYFLYDKEELVYIGRSDNVLYRIGCHIQENSKVFDAFEIFETSDSIALESMLIEMFKPKYNKVVPHAKRKSIASERTLISAFWDEMRRKSDDYFKSIRWEVTA